MSEKSNDVEWKEFCMKTEKPGEVKRASKNIKLISEWDDIKLTVMEFCLIQKYNQEPYKTKLLNTGDAILQEGNLWHDLYWGVDLKTGRGENHLGKLIMKIRTKLQKEA